MRPKYAPVFARTLRANEVPGTNNGTGGHESRWLCGDNPDCLGAFGKTREYPCGR